MKRLLDLARTCCKGQGEPFLPLCDQFNRETMDGCNMLAYSDFLGKAIRTTVEVKEERDIDSLFSGGKTTALTRTIAGLDDFELMAFLVVPEAAGPDTHHSPVRLSGKAAFGRVAPKAKLYEHGAVGARLKGLFAE